MTVLRGELAIKQSRALVRTFKKMKDYIVSNEMLPSNRQMLQLSMQVTNTTQSIAEIKKSLNQVEDDIAIAMGELSDVVRKSELAEIYPEEQPIVIWHIIKNCRKRLKNKITVE